MSQVCEIRTVKVSMNHSWLVVQLRFSPLYVTWPDVDIHVSFWPDFAGMAEPSRCVICASLSKQGTESDWRERWYANMGV